MLWLLVPCKMCKLTTQQYLFTSNILNNRAGKPKVIRTIPSLVKNHTTSNNK